MMVMMAIEMMRVVMMVIEMMRVVMMVIEMMRVVMMVMFSSTTLPVPGPIMVERSEEPRRVFSEAPTLDLSSPPFSLS